MALGDIWWKLKVMRSRFTIYSRYLLHGPFLYRNWLYMFWSRKTAEAGILELRNGLRFKIRPQTSDRSTVNENFILKPYTLDGRFAIGPTDKVLDVGANIGAFTVNAAAQARNGVVWAVEPVSANMRILEENVALNELKNVKLVQAAVGAAATPVTVAIRGASSTIAFQAGPQVEREEVEQISLESLVCQMGGVDLMKMDCEGAEFDIFFSTPAEALHKIRRIAMEYHNVSAEKNVYTLKAFLEIANFEVTVVGKNWSGLLFAIKK
jgi:FkbM family methyltransferase